MLSSPGAGLAAERGVELWSTAPMDLHAPLRPQPVVVARFPWIPAATPVVLSVVMALMFSSPLALMMGVLGPVMVAGSWWEGRRGSRQAQRVALEDFDRESELHRAEIESERTREKYQALAAMPSVLERVAQPLWRPGRAKGALCRVGTGWFEPPAGHRLVGSGALSGMPAVIDTAVGVALVGPESCADIWRALAMSWVMHSPPEQISPRPGVGEQDWGVAFPRDIWGPSRAVWVQSIDDVPAECHTIIVAKGEHLITVHEASGASRDLAPDRLSSSHIGWLVERMGLLDDRAVASVTPDYSRRDQLVLDIGNAQWDLVKEGPHGVVWGATGSGKSVTVCALVTSIAQHYSPRQVVCIVIDFKGGAGLAPLARLPHTIGMVTDLDQGRAARALSGLRAELIKRERLLSTHGVSDCGDLAPDVHCPRLLVVIDEAAWLLTTFPEWGEALADVLARGRSLGIHVLLSTQRIAGVITPAMMANISLRVCGRISDDAEVLGWLPGLSQGGVDTLRRAHPGTIVVAGAHTLAREATISHSVDTVECDENSPPLWRVWAEDLPTELPLAEGMWALVDEPTRQTHRWANYLPDRDGSILVVGDAHSGRTTALAALARQCAGAMRAPQLPYELWLWLLRSPASATALVLDDIDLLLHSAGREGAAFLLDELAEYQGVVLMAALASSHHARALSRMVESHVVLSIANSDRQLAWDATVRGGLPPGRARWKGEILQIAHGGTMPEAWTPPPGASQGEPFIVITHHLDQWAGSKAACVVTPEGCMGQWHSLSGMLTSHTVVIDGPSATEIRQATAGRLMLPPLPVPEGKLQAWRRGTLSLTRPTQWRE